MKPQVGRHYRTRCGQTAFVKQSTHVRSAEGIICALYFGIIEESGNLCMWSEEDGRRSPDQHGDHPDDLIAIIAPD